MPSTTPPKGRPTPGRRDRSVARQRAASRRRVIRYAWVVIALVLLAAVLVLGTGTGGDLNVDGGPLNLVLPAFVPGGRVVRRLRLTPPRW